MEENECLRCIHHLTQGGHCFSERRNCLMFKEEPRGKVVKKDFKVYFSRNSADIIKLGEYVVFENDMKVKVEKIKEVNPKEMYVIMNVSYHEKYETPELRRSCFKLINGGKNGTVKENC